MTTGKLTGENQDIVTEFRNYTLTETQTSLKIWCSRKESREFIGYCGLFELRHSRLPKRVSCLVSVILKSITFQRSIWAICPYSKNPRSLAFLEWDRTKKYTPGGTPATQGKADRISKASSEEEVREGEAKPPRATDIVPGLSFSSTSYLLPAPVPVLPSR